ncbi:MAG: glycosyl transferase family 1 [Sphingomonas bacterium]|jgi:sugar transferase (PEP-CTERM/EpsH1 system associated)|uniref:TIGR03087 family PEP-CTERM/XrtA system glycosyltransferase n=1 Tax=Sphingomonas bacterium TaxID=1895847 RepID=UPI0026393028|nr:TIGR03087 family PEP-CTERM/XrtA system glycosyltransferase [Sphingomonas bacterium]MDB5705052.1 glycosyl transferase family 1 [Sphingomonas bacterium]
MGDILFLAHRVPYPPDRGDKIRGFNVLKFLSERKRVHLIAFADDTRDMKRKNGLSKFTGNRSIIWRSKPRAIAALEAFFSRKPLSLTAFENKPLREAVDNILARHSIDTIYVFSSQMAQYLPARPRQRVIMDFCDMDSAKFASYAKTSTGPLAWFMKREAKMLFSHERAVAQRADASLFVSEAEAELFRSKTGAERVHVVENGIDTVFFDPTAQFKRIDTTGALIVFTGQMDYRPNIEAVTWFVETILPHVRIRHPQARFAIVGRNPTDAVKALAKQPGVIVTGEVADVRGWVAAASVVVAPLKLARGVQNKVLEAMAMARPVVASTAAAQGIDHGGTIRIGGTVGEIAEEVIAVLDDPAVGNAMGRDARAQVQRRYSWDACLAPLDSILGIRVKAPPRKSAA